MTNEVCPPSDQGECYLLVANKICTTRSSACERLNVKVKWLLQVIELKWSLLFYCPIEVIACDWRDIIIGPCWLNLNWIVSHLVFNVHHFSYVYGCGLGLYNFPFGRGRGTKWLRTCFPTPFQAFEQSNWNLSKLHVRTTTYSLWE